MKFEPCDLCGINDCEKIGFSLQGYIICIHCVIDRLSIHQEDIFGRIYMCGKIYLSKKKDLLDDDDVVQNNAGCGFNLRMAVTFNNTSGNDSNVDLCVLICKNGLTLASLSDDKVVDAY